MKIDYEVVSTEEGFTFFIEDGTDVFVFETGKPMSGEEVAKELGITRMAVSNSLKRSFSKIYKNLKIKNPILNSFEIVVLMMLMLRVSYDSISEVCKFYSLFPKDIKEQVEDELGIG